MLAGIVIYTMRKNIKEDLKDGMTFAVHHNNQTQFKQALDFIQTHLKCCGANSYKDYIRRKFNEETSGNSLMVKRKLTENLLINSTYVPDSCFRHSLERNCTGTNCYDRTGRHSNNTGIYTRGCFPALLQMFEREKWKVLGASFGVLIVHSAAIGSAILVLIGVQNNHYNYQRIVNVDDSPE